MFRSLLSPGLLALGLLAMASMSAADPVPAGRQSMSAGIHQFHQGNYQAAREQFEAALALGMDSPALHYNLGVACFKTGDYRAAERYFSTLLEGPDQALAQYNLGLVALADDRYGDAEGWFRQAASRNAPDTIRQLADRQLAELDRTSLPSHAYQDIVTQGYLSAGVGYDSNMAGVPDGFPSNRGSLFAELVGAGTLSRAVNPDWQIVWDGVAYGQDYVQGREYDTSVLQSRVAGIHTGQDVDYGLRAGVSRAWLADDVLETRFGLAVFAQSDTCPMPGSLRRCSLTLAAEHINGGPDYAAYDGQWYQLEARGEQAFDHLVMEIFYRWQTNDREDFRQDELFVSVSPTLHELGVDALYPVRADLAVGFEAAVRHARYRHRHQWLDETGVAERRREDVRAEFGLMAEFYLSSQWLVRNQWRLQDQISRIDRYEYRRQTFTVSLEGVF